ncbi:MAG: aldehyde dehydrogenase (NADP(+)) [Bacteroidales bacterium]
MLHGKNRIGFSLSANGNKAFRAFNPATLQDLEPDFYCATDQEIHQTMQKAQNAYFIYKQLSGRQKSAFLDSIADEIRKSSDLLIERVNLETGLPESRIKSELGRTLWQLRIYSNLLKDGSWVHASIDKAIPSREPMPKPDLRKMLCPIGPVVVFSASNFPLAYSTCGSDTASALAAGNPVIVKAHPSHPGSNQIVAEAINNAAFKTGMPDGVFSTLYDNGFELGLKLVKHPVTKAVGFTGSFSGGMALYRAAQEREDPIPVFAEMGSLNPVLLMPEKLGSDYDKIAEILVNSVTGGMGQFCTKPGLIAAIDDVGFENFINAFSAKLKKVNPETLINKNIWENFYRKRGGLLAEQGLKIIYESDLPEGMKGRPTLAIVAYENFKKNPLLAEEVFGPFSLLIKCNDIKELTEFSSGLKGQLTVSIFGTEKEFSANQEIINTIREKAGRLIFNGPPTGVEVCDSIVHSGPFPACIDSRFTSVGPEAIYRFVRPVAFQNMPQFLLPEELKDGNPLKIRRKVDGIFTKD